MVQVLPQVKGSTSGYLCYVCTFEAHVWLHGQQDNDKKKKIQQKKKKIGCNIKCTVTSHLTNVAPHTQLGTICQQHLAYIQKNKVINGVF